LSGYPVDVTISGGFAYIAEGNAGLHIIDISNPAAPFEIGSIALLAESGCCCAWFHSVFAESGGVFSMINVTNPHSPEELPRMYCGSLTKLQWPVTMPTQQ